ncbi:MAG: (2Fe-2S)-binding protein [Gemmatimonadetes bacterium]|nr:(2Fe-2S)-binding protein [Gemmatimonadota bacterium]
MNQQIELNVNNTIYDLSLEPRKTLLAVLRDRLGLTGTKEGCSTGDCGACTVLLDGEPVTSCLVLAVAAEGREVTTVEGIADVDALHPVQEAMVNMGGLQCGFCTPGFIVSSYGLLQKNAAPSEEDIRRALAGNLCRCTGYTKIVEAVQEAAKRLAGRKGGKRAAA